MQQMVSIETSQGGSLQQAQMLTAYNKQKMASTTRSSECIKVCVRVRPLLPRELGREEVVYYPSGDSDHLEVSKLS